MRIYQHAAQAIESQAFTRLRVVLVLGMFSTAARHKLSMIAVSTQIAKGASTVKQGVSPAQIDRKHHRHEVQPFD